MKKLRLLVPTLTLAVSGLTTPLLVSCGKKAEVIDGSEQITTYYGVSGQDDKPWKFKFKDEKTKPDSWAISFTGEAPTSGEIGINSDGYVYWRSTSGSYLEVGQYTFKVAAYYNGENYYSNEITLTVNPIEEDCVIGGSTNLQINCDEAGQDQFAWVAKKAGGSDVENPTFSLQLDGSTKSLEGITISKNGQISWANNVQAGVYTFKVKAVATNYEAYSVVVTYTFIATPKTLTVSGGDENISTYFGESDSDANQWVAKLDDEDVSEATLELIPYGELKQIPKNITINNGHVSWQHSVDGQTLNEGVYTFKVKATYRSKTAQSNPITLTVQKSEGLIVVGGSPTLKGDQLNPGFDKNAWKTRKDGKDISGATLSLEAEAGSLDITGITIDSGIVAWPKHLKAGVYRFHVKSISKEGTAVSVPISLTIVTEQLIVSNTKTKYQYTGNLGGQDDYQWKAVFKGETVDTEMSLIPSGSTTVIPKGLSIQNGYITWTSDLAYGTYYFKVQAVYQEIFIGTSIELEFKLTEATDQSKFTWTDKNVDKKTITLAGLTEESANIVIPSYYKDTDDTIYKVTNIGNFAFEEHKSIQTIIVPDAITSFGNQVFRNCESLTSIVLPYHLNSCEYGALYHCIGLTTFTIPDGWTTIFNGFFASCEKLATIIIPDSVTSFENNVFWACHKLTSFVFPPLVDRISEYCFYECTGFTSFNIPKTIKTLDRYAFSSCQFIKDMYYDGTKEEFLALTRNEKWHHYVGREVPGGTNIHFSDGTFKLDEIDPEPEI